jgi:hypothetical protein
MIMLLISLVYSIRTFFVSTFLKPFQRRSTVGKEAFEEGLVAQDENLTGEAGEIRIL